MFGAIIGDIVGSRFEFNNIKTKDFELFDSSCTYTDDTVMTCAVAAALCSTWDHIDNFKNALTYWMLRLGKAYPEAGYGGNFYQWIHSQEHNPYNSFGNGSAMRVSPCGAYASSKEESIILARESAIITHNHPEGIKGAECVGLLIYLAKIGFTKEQLYQTARDYYKLNFTLDEIRDFYEYNETCQGTIPQAIQCFLESENFEDCLRNAISIGGDSDTIAAIACSIAEWYYGIPKDFINQAKNYLPNYLIQIVERFCYMFNYNPKLKINTR